MADDTDQWRERASGPDLPGRTTAPEAPTESEATYQAWIRHGSACQPCLDGVACETGAVLYQDYREARIDTPRAAP